MQAEGQLSLEYGALETEHGRASWETEDLRIQLSGYEPHQLPSFLPSGSSTSFPLGTFPP